MNYSHPAKPLELLVEVTMPDERPEKPVEHRRMARAAIRVAMRHGATSSELEAEYEAIVELETNGG